MKPLLFVLVVAFFLTPFAYSNFNYDPGLDENQKDIIEKRVEQAMQCGSEIDEDTLRERFQKELIDGWNPREKHCAYMRAWRKAHVEHCSKYRSDRYNRIKNDPKFRDVYEAFLKSARERMRNRRKKNDSFLAQDVNQTVSAQVSSINEIPTTPLSTRGLQGLCQDTWVPSNPYAEYALFEPMLTQLSPLEEEVNILLEECLCLDQPQGPPHELRVGPAF